jgi:hypothetical protein
MKALLKMAGLAGAVLLAAPTAWAGDVHFSFGFSVNTPGIHARIVAPVPVVRPPVYCPPPAVVRPPVVVTVPRRGFCPLPVMVPPPFWGHPGRVYVQPRPWGYGAPGAVVMVSPHYGGHHPGPGRGVHHGHHR